MGAYMVRRLIHGGHQCVVYDINPENIKRLESFRSRKQHTFAENVLSAMRFKFGGHVERPTGG
jgi:6-phosphogluconate dehydrogenase (decarboxylating)